MNKRQIDRILRENGKRPEVSIVKAVRVKDSVWRAVREKMLKQKPVPTWEELLGSFFEYYLKK